MPLALTKTSVAFNGMMWGQQPSLTINSKGSLEINSIQEAIGRTHWSQKLTVVYRGGDYDSVAMKGSTCDINYLTRVAFVNGKTSPIGGTVSKLVDFDTSKSPTICGTN